MTHLPDWGKLAAMQTLGLSGETKRRDGFFRSIFWPTVENAWDVDYLGQQGFWICLLIAGFQFGFALLTGSPLLIAVGLLAAVLYLVGGMGVREKSWPAAAMICACYLLPAGNSYCDDGGLAAFAHGGPQDRLPCPSPLQSSRYLYRLGMEAGRRRRRPTAAIQRHLARQVGGLVAAATVAAGKDSLLCAGSFLAPVKPVCPGRRLADATRDSASARSSLICGNTARNRPK